MFTNGDIATAVHASGAVPLMFRSVNIKQKHYVDGGLVDKAPIRALAEHEELDGIIVHYILSRSLKRKGNWFLKKRFTPWWVYNHSHNIMRHMDFIHQVKWAQEKGLKVWIVCPNLPRLGPFKMKEGRKSFDMGYKHTKRAIRKNDFIDTKDLIKLGR